MLFLSRRGTPAHTLMKGLIIGCLINLWVLSTFAAGVEILEAYALTSLFNQTGGVNWRYNDNWLVQEDVCTWFGVRCVQEKIWLVVPSAYLRVCY